MFVSETEFENWVPFICMHNVLDMTCMYDKKDIHIVQWYLPFQ